MFLFIPRNYPVSVWQFINTTSNFSPDAESSQTIYQLQEPKVNSKLMVLSLLTYFVQFVSFDGSHLIKEQKQISFVVRLKQVEQF
jgi:hypothetical protein